MNETNNLQYSTEGSAARYLYLKDQQDVNFFVEDVNHEFEYERILKKLFPAVKIKTIFTAGGKPAMKERFKEYGEFDPHNSSHPNIYIVDGDFDRIIRPNEMIVNDHFIYLDSYNIEDYLLDEDACYDFTCGNLRKTLSEVRSCIKFADWYNLIILQASKLFFIYCYIQAYHPTVENISNSPFKFIDHKTGFEREGAFEEYKSSLSNEHSIVIDESKLNVLKQSYKALYGEDLKHLICGKFLLKSLRSYLISKGLTSFTEEQLRWWLVCNINIQSFDSLTQKIQKIIQNSKEDETL